jgi:hypothetical protein
MKNFSISKVLIFALFTVITLITSLIGNYSYIHRRDAMKADLQGTLERVGERLKLNLIPIRYQKLINPVKCCKRFNGIFILSEFI